MFIGHLPGAYLALRPLQRHIPPLAFAAGLVGSVLPDLDLIWFYFVDNRAFHHHEYITHRPILWAAALLLGQLLRRFQPLTGTSIAMLAIGALIHLCLDSIAGAVTWGWPWWDHKTTLVTVPATHDHWIKSFLAHWTFKVELTLCVLAAAVWWRSRRARRP